MFLYMYHLFAAVISHDNEPSLLRKSVLQSTFTDGHCFRPDFDISVIKGKLNKTTNMFRVNYKAGWDCPLTFFFQFISSRQND